MTSLLSAEYQSKQGADSVFHLFSDYFWERTLEMCTGFSQPGLWLPDTKRYLVSPARSSWDSLWGQTEPSLAGWDDWEGPYLVSSMPHVMGGDSGHRRQCTLVIKMIMVVVTIVIECLLCAKVVYLVLLNPSKGYRYCLVEKTLRHSEKEQGNGEITSRWKHSAPVVFWYRDTSWSPFVKTGAWVKALSSELFSKGSINVFNRLRHFWDKGEWELRGGHSIQNSYLEHRRLSSDPNGESP